MVSAGLPARTDELPEALRIHFAQFDLTGIAAAAEEQVAVHNYATEAAIDLLHSLNASDIPNTATLVELQKEYAATELEKFLKEMGGLGDVARHLAAPAESDHEGVSEKDVKQDVLSQLHPDRVGGAAYVGTAVSQISDHEEIFKSVTEAKQNADTTSIQGIYARTVARGAVGSGNLSAAYLERTRYKAWLAQQAGKGRFASTAEVDEWKERELKIAPYKIRAHLLSATVGLFLKSLGASEDAPAVVPHSCSYGMKTMLEKNQKLREKIDGEDATAEEFARVNLADFDTRLGELLDQLYLFFQHRALWGDRWSDRRTYKTTDYAERLAAAANTLTPRDPYQIIGSMVLEGLKDLPPIQPEWPQEPPYHKSKLGNDIYTTENYPNKKF